jgi:hypothetical protein
VKAYTQAIHLQTHEKTDRGEKLYGCKQCGNSFTCPSTLKRHEGTHTREKAYGYKQIPMTLRDMYEVSLQKNFMNVRDEGTASLYTVPLILIKKLTQERNPTELSNMKCLH